MKLFEHLDGFISNKITAVKGIFTLFKLETKLACMNILPLMINCGIIIASVFTMWLATMGLLGYVVTVLLNGRVWTGLVCVLLFNLALIGFLLKRIKLNIQRMSFDKTRESLGQHNSRGAYGLPANPIATNSEH